jgi:citrate lyase subunit beta / citryl-CoA lyase
MSSADHPPGDAGGRPAGLAPRRTCLTVPGSSERFLAKARQVAADEVILDLEDSVAAGAKRQARELVAAALGRGWPGRQLLAVRVNGAVSPWAYRDVIEVAEHARDRLDAIVLPKVSAPAHVVWLDLLLGQIEQAAGLEPGKLAIEAQIEDAAGLAAVEQVAAASPRLAALIFGPADFMASLGMRSLRIGAQPEDYAGGDAFHYPLMKILVAARSAGLQAIDGPYAAIGDLDGLTAAAASVAALGYDGKWVVHPDQISPVNEAFSPGQDEYDRAESILDAYEHATEVQRRGAVMLDGEMIDEASRKLALTVAARGRAAGRTRPGRSLRFAPAEHRK